MSTEPAAAHSELSCFRVSPTQLEDHGFVEQLAKLLNTRNHVNGGSGGQSQLVVRSASLTDDQLEAVVSSLKAHNTWGVARREKVLSLDELIPSAEDLASAHDGSRFGDTWARQPDWVEFNWTAPRARPPLCAPDHLVDAPARQTFIEGGWMSDFAFQFDGPRIRLSEENRWVLPKRWRMAGAFGVARAGAQRSAPPARRSRSGDLALFVTDSVPVAEVKIPTSTEAFNYALAYDGAWVKAGEENGSALPTNKVAWIRPSNEARYLIGILGLLDGVHKAGQLLLHPFMRDIFTQLGGTPSVSSAATIPTANRLAKRARLQPSFDLKDGAEREALSILISQAARSTRASKDYLSLSGIMNGWEAYRKEWWAANPQQGDGDDAIDWDDHERRSLEDCLIAMRAQQVVFQGHQWVCTHCHHRNWVDMSELRTKLSCSVCQTATDAPVDTKWLFRPNEFLIESLRDHSALSLIWVLASLADRARRSLIYAEPTWLGYDHDHDEPDAEADLFAVLDGRAFLCEVKSSWGSLRAADIVKLVALARRLRPDAVLLAIMENGNKFQSEIADAKTDLATVGIDFELLTPKLRSPEDGPYLYFG